MPAPMSSILIVDDDGDFLNRLGDDLRSRLTSDGVEVRQWVPEDGQDFTEEFERYVDAGTELVVTDTDLTKRGATGFFGATIVSWCQDRAIPVGDFSRRNTSRQPREPNLFEFRAPTGVEEAGAWAATMLRGFMQLRASILAAGDHLQRRSPAAVLAAVLDRPHLEGQFALYMSRIGAANSSLVELVLEPSEVDERAVAKDRLLTYVVGHVLANAVLRFSGPILSMDALCGYVATSPEERDVVTERFAQARYDGPFAGDVAFYWRADVDAAIDELANALGDEVLAETPAGLRRAIVERTLGRPLATHGCARCDGTLGGFVCPLTRRTVCERSDCSVAANSWVPAGADICRIERDFYDEWAPLLGL